MEDFLVYLEENKEGVLSVFEEYYTGKASEEGEMMLTDDLYYDNCDMDAIQLYEDFAHCTGHSASYEGAYGVIKEFGSEHNLDPNDEELQWEVLMILEKEPN